jgi:hypothetical protein
MWKQGKHLELNKRVWRPSVQVHADEASAVGAKDLLEEISNVGFGETVVDVADEDNPSLLGRQSEPTTCMVVVVRICGSISTDLEFGAESSDSS